MSKFFTISARLIRVIRSGLLSLLPAKLASITLGILFGQFEEKCCSDWQTQHLLLLSLTLGAVGGLEVAIPLAFL